MNTRQKNFWMHEYENEGFLILEIREDGFRAMKNGEIHFFPWCLFEGYEEANDDCSS